MPKTKEKTVPIRITARFEVTFVHQIPASMFKKLDGEKVTIDDVVDESVCYDALRYDGDCEMDWDYVVRPRKS